MTVKIITKNDVEIHCIKAEPGFKFQRKSDGMIFGDELELGYIYYLFEEGNPVKLDNPIKELPEHYIEIEDIVEEYVDLV